MHDPRLNRLAEILTCHSTKIEEGEFVLIEGFDIPAEVVIVLIRAVRKAGGIPLVELKQNQIQRELLCRADEEGVKLMGHYEAYRMERVQAYIGIRGSHNITELSDVPTKAMQLYQKHWLTPVHFDIRVPKTKWVVLRWPSPAMAQQAKMSTEAFEDFYFDVCTFDYNRLEIAIQPLKSLMESTDKVRIVSPETDLEFSIKDIPVIPCAGECNIPDGECFTAPVRQSINGVIHFNTPTIYQGTTFTDICLRFENGKIIDATSNNTQKLHQILDSDEGARYIGEFSLGLNPYIHKPMLDILFDEKISGSFHFTPGQAYEEADNGVRSTIHWDMVMVQTPEFGGGEIYFDNRLVRKNGEFIVPELEGLNPENLKKSSGENY